MTKLAPQKIPMTTKHKPHRKPHKIVTTQAEDKTFSHEHHYHGQHEPVFAGTSQNMDDLKQHMEDHFGEGAAAPDGQAEAAAPGESDEPQPGQ